MTDHHQAQQTPPVQSASVGNKDLHALPGKLYDQSANYAALIRREIQAGDKDDLEIKKFIDRQANEFCVHEKFGNFKAKEVLINQYTAKFGESLEEHIERLKQKAENLNAGDKDMAYENAMKLPEYMQEQSEPNTYLAYSKIAGHLAHDLGITERKARSLMVQAYKDRHNGKNYFTDFAKIEERCLRRERGLPDISQTYKQKGSPGM